MASQKLVQKLDQYTMRRRCS